MTRTFKKSLQGTGQSKNLNPKHLNSLLGKNIHLLNAANLNDYIDTLYAYQYMLSRLSPETLNKNGFSIGHVQVYKPLLEKTLFKAQSIKSEKLEAEQLPGQISLFGLGRVFDMARQEHSYTKDGSVYIRQSKQELTKIMGKPCDISFALNKVVKGHYCIIEASRLQPSHIGSIQNPLHFIPEAQPRNRAISASGHTTPKVIAENLRPSEIVEGATAYAGAPVINERGEAIQGNGRAFTIKYYYANFPDDPAAYKRWLEKNKACYDIAEPFSHFLEPVMVRLLRVDDETAIELGQFTQKDLEAVAGETTQIKSKVNRVSDKTLDLILNELLAKDTGEQSLSELIRSGDVLAILVRENILRGDELELYVRQGNITETGVQFITRFLLNLIFKDGDVNTADVFTGLPVSVQKAIEKSALYVLKCRGEYSLNAALSKAVLGLRDYLLFKPNGSMEEWSRQKDIFGTSPQAQFTALELKLIRIFADSPTQKIIIGYFKNYAGLATEKPGDMFEPDRPALPLNEALQQAFGVVLNQYKETPEHITPENTTEQNHQRNSEKLKAIAIAKAKAIALQHLQNLQTI